MQRSEAAKKASKQGVDFGVATGRSGKADLIFDKKFAMKCTC